MYKILFTIIVSLLPVASLFADSMVSPTFTIDLGQMDPVGGSHSSGPSGYSWKWALTVVLQRVSDLLLYIIPIIAILSTLIAGYYYIFSAWDSEKATKAKTIIKWNIIAIVVGFMSWTIIQIIASFFS